MFRLGIDAKEAELFAIVGSRKQVESARRKAAIAVLSYYTIVNWKGDMSTHFQQKTDNLIDR